MGFLLISGGKHKTKIKSFTLASAEVEIMFLHSSCVSIVLEMGLYPQGPIKKTKLGYKLSKQRTQLKIASGTNPNFLFVQNCPLSLGIFKTV